MGEIIYYKLYQKFKFDSTDKWCMHIPESARENEMYKIFWDTNGSPNLSQTSRPSDSQQQQQNLPNSGLCRSNWVKLKETENYWDFARELKKLRNMEVTMIPIVIGTFSTVTKRLLLGLGNKRTNGDHLNYSVVEMDQNTEKSPGDLRKLAVSQTSIESYQLALTWVK